ncbi:MAG: hypothetical protein B5M53_07325 [Candidatus Cloacimonas sp. 4484_209]|nr:MAG: hypothetical protein B5M53_07325 [Candidatus Cloacimonas sp. 4484_209]
MNLPKISIVTPSYNQGDFLERTIQSVLSQSYPNFEYIILDNKSTDKSIEIIKKYKEKLTYWISESDRGQSDAINKGFNIATGELLCWINSDDVLFQNTLRQVAKAYQKNPDVDIITGNIVYIDEADRIIKCIRVPRQRWFFYHYNVGYFCAPAVFFKKELFWKVGGLNINLHYSMDIDLWHKFRLANAKVCHIKAYLGGFRIHSMSKTAKLRKNRKIFENPETTIVRRKYIPNVSKITIRFFRYLYNFWQIFNLNYAQAWVELRRFKGKTWQEIFGPRL